MQDRLSELRRGMGASSKFEERNDLVQDTNQSGGDLMPEFLAKSKNVQELIERVKINNEEMRRLKISHKNATLAEKEKAISKQLNSLVEETNSHNSQIKDMMEEMSADIVKSKKAAPDEPETRMKINAHAALGNKFAEVLRDTQTIEVEVQQAVRDKISRQARLIDDTLTDKQINDICQDPDGASKLIANKMFGQSHIKLQNAVSDIQDKYRDIQRLEASIQVVFQMQQDLALLVHAQGEMLDNIELNVDTAKNYVTKAEKELRTAKKDHQAARKRLCLIVICGLVILVVILVPIISVVASKA